MFEAWNVECDKWSWPRRKQGQFFSVSLGPKSYEKFAHPPLSSKKELQKCAHDIYDNWGLQCQHDFRMCYKKFLPRKKRMKPINIFTMCFGNYLKTNLSE